MVDFVHRWQEREFSKIWLIKKLEVRMSKFYTWHERYGKYPSPHPQVGPAVYNRLNRPFVFEKGRLCGT